MRRLFPILLTVVIVAMDARACAIFTLVRDGRVFFGNNEDYIKPGVIWFERGRKGRHGRVNVGFDDDFAQGGMNEKGLAFDAATVTEIPWEADPEKETPKNLPGKILDECATVEEAIAYFHKYNCKHLSGGQFLFADATGAAALIAWLPGQGLSITRREGDALVATNTRLGRSGYRCARHVKATRVLGEHQGASLETMTAVLDAIHQEGPAAFTSYSTVYDLPNRRVYIYNLADFTQVREFDLTAQLAEKRKQVFKLAGLFPDGPTVDDLTARPQRTGWDTRIELDPAILARYVGSYRLQPDICAEITAGGEGALAVRTPGHPGATLVPESQTQFRIAPDRGTVTFDVTEDGDVNGLTLHKQADVYAKRVE